MTVSDAARWHGTAHSHFPSTPATVAGLAVLVAALHVFTPFNHDEAWILQSAGRLLDGGRFGTDIVDVNPPLAWWICIAPVWLARQIGTRTDIIATMFTTLMAALSLIAVDGLVDRTMRGRRVLLPIATTLLLFIPGYDFGQREHWILLLTLPYVIARCRRAAETELSCFAGVTIGFAAGLGFCLKPYFLLVPICLEIWLLAQTRRGLLWLCPETIALAITGLGYAVLIVVYAPAYLDHVVPNAVLGYWTYNSTLPNVVLNAVVQLAPAAVVALVGYYTRCEGERTPLVAQVLAVAGAASLVAALLQMKAWSYHFLPSVFFFDLSAIVILVATTPRAGTNAARLGAIAVIVAIAFSNSAAELIRSFDRGGTKNRVDQLAAVFRAHAGPSRIVFGFITSPRDVLPATIASEVKWAAPFCCNYLLPAAVRADEAPAANRSAIRAAALDQAEMAVSALRAYEPGVIVIDAGDHMLGFRDRKFSYVDWLAAHTSFADILRQYREISPINPFRVFVRN